MACANRVILNQPVEKKKNFFSRMKLSSNLMFAGAALATIAYLAYALAYSNNELAGAEDYIRLLLNKCEKWLPVTE
jgi:hypothetical protein